ncbi:MAG: type II toxin-antitoxin system death-on-curing family toxin [Halobacteriales archaeon]|nr:type II toxin-antitoxin system death-on-curing family toxin [Halobacteriales archaeon]
MSEALWYPSVDDVLAIHEAILAEYPETEQGVRDRGAIDFMVGYVESGRFDDVPDTIHGKAFHLLRLLVANHPFVDGNKRTALNTVVVFYVLNGYRLSYDEEIEGILKRFGSDEANVERQVVLDYLRSHTEHIALEDAVAQWRDDLLAYGVERLSEERMDPND